MKRITIEELNENLDFYLEQSQYEDIYIVDGQRMISVLTNPQMQAYFRAKSMVEELNLHDTINVSDEDIIVQAIDKRNYN
ncbi:MAG: hypothetical protein K6C32_01905 [Bacilli bacterium]|nr:hypothetical protein [Bacilli bacterium]